jgi:hypothetical protein
MLDISAMPRNAGDELIPPTWRRYAASALILAPLLLAFGLRLWPKPAENEAVKGLALSL